MFSKVILLLPLLFLMACLDQKDSPNKSDGAPTQNEKENPFQPVLPESIAEKEEQKVFCGFYPSIYHQPSWIRYFEIYKSQIQQGKPERPLFLSVRNGKRQKYIQLTDEEQITWMGSDDSRQKGELTYIPAMTIDGCHYPEVVRFQNENALTYMIGEWKTSDFYQPAHIVEYRQGGIEYWQDEFSGSINFDLNLYRELLGRTSARKFFRRRQGVFSLQLEGTNQIGPHEVEDMKLMFTVRSENYGNLVVRYQDGTTEAHSSLLQIFRVWDAVTNEVFYLIDFGAEPPYFLDDEGERQRQRIAGNLKSDQHRIRVIFPMTDVNAPNPFVGEIVSLSTYYRWFKFSGLRPARQETSDN